MTTAPLSRLLDRHAEIEARFLAHQEALLARNLSAARAELDAHRSLLEAHVHEEERVVLPAYAALGPAPRGGAADVFHAEHGKLLGWLDRLEHLMRGLEGRATLEARDVIAVLDREATFKHLMEHHDLRERRYLYPALDAGLEPARLQELWRRLEARGVPRR